jgi:hypothetical protein
VKITIDLVAGGFGGKRDPVKSDIDKNIEALDRAIKNKKLANDDNSLIDTKSILEAIKMQLKN